MFKFNSVEELKTGIMSGRMEEGEGKMKRRKTAGRNLKIGRMFRYWIP